MTDETDLLAALRDSFRSGSPATSDDVVSRARAALDGITPGPWELGRSWSLVAHGPDVVLDAYYADPCPSCGDEIDVRATVLISAEDLALVVAAPDLVRDLLARVEKAEAWAAWFAAAHDHTVKQAEAFGFGEFRVTTWAYEQAVAAVDKHRAAVDRVRNLAEHWRAADSWHGNAYADDVLRALDGEADRA